MGLGFLTVRREDFHKTVPFIAVSSMRGGRFEPLMPLAEFRMTFLIAFANFMGLPCPMLK